MKRVELLMATMMCLIRNNYNLKERRDLSGNNNNTIVSTKTPTIKLKHVIIKYSRTTRTNLPTEIPIEITMIPTLE